ncbi:MULTISPECIES: restriction endonuclease subunit S [unclassified Polaribacter]|uniref:restriction endonuclease subunit S n=1 Tax=unclassified Polaribacter TaxID=196858 RepID=UPI001CB95599|nr:MULTISPECIES: restriction endonuclease subunit S [unclassified Polaribacter]
MDEIDIDTYISTDNLLQNKQGKVNAVKMPTQTVNNVTRFDKGDILIGNIRPYLKKIWLANYTGGSSSDVLTLKIKENFNSTFVYYSLFRDDFFEHMMNGSKGTKMPRGDKTQVLDFTIPDFSINRQKQIAKVLSDLDAKIELNNKINQELEAMAKTLYDYWFVQFDFPAPSSSSGQAWKPYKSSGGQMVFNEELKRVIPVGWEVKKIKEIAKTGSGSTPLKSKKEYYENGNVPWINSGEVNASFIISAKKHISQLGLEKSSAKLFKKGTILMAMYGATAGQVSLIDLEACTNQAICGINTNDEKFKYYTKFSLEDLYQYLINLSTGSARDNLSQDKIKELNIIIPEESLISTFHNKVKSNFDNILLNLKQNQKLSELRDWLLPMLMNGQITVGGAEKEMKSLGLVAEGGEEYK